MRVVTRLYKGTKFGEGGHKGWSARRKNERINKKVPLTLVEVHYNAESKVYSIRVPIPTVFPSSTLRTFIYMNVCTLPYHLNPSTTHRRRPPGFQQWETNIHSRDRNTPNNCTLWLQMPRSIRPNALPFLSPTFRTVA